MKNKLLFLALFAAIMLAVLPVTAKADDHHEGYTAWSDTAALPTTNGSYYLTADVELSAAWTLGTGKNITLCLNGHNITQTVAGNRVILVQGNAVLNLYDCSEEQGIITGANITSTTMNGAGIFVNGTATLNMYGGIVTGNTSAANGGGVGIGGGTFNMYGGKISGNSAVGGGGLFIRASADSAFNMYGGEISENTASANGGGIGTYDSIDKVASINIYDGLITGNTAVKGGGIYTKKIAFNTEGGVISDNTATSYGGGIITNGNVTADIEGLTITGNTGLRGGGMSIETTGDSVLLKNATITGNIATGTSDRGGAGIYLGVNQALTISGKMIITGNTLNGNASNLTVAFNRTAIESSLSSESVIGVNNYPAENKNLISSVDSANLGCYLPDDEDARLRYNSNGLLTAIAATDHVQHHGYTACDHSSATWKAWTSSTSLPNASGYYYLTCDVNITSTQARTDLDITICLNGYNITQTYTATQRRIIGVNGGSLHICDCSAVTRGDGTYDAGILSGGKATASAGAAGIYVYNGGKLYLEDGIISGNVSDGSGGAIVVSGTESYFEMNGGEISENTANLGGAVFIGNSNAKMTGGKIVGNTAVKGGGVYVNGNSNFEMTGGKITGNTATGGSAVYVDIDANLFTFGDVAIASAEMIGGNTSDENHTEPIWSRGFVEIAGAVATEGIVYQERTAAKFESLKGTVSDNVTAAFAVKLAPKSGDNVRMTYQNGSETVAEYGTYDEESGLYIFQTTVNINRIANPLGIVILSNSATINKKEDYSILDYFNALAAMTDESVSEETKEFMANLIVFADLLQQYAENNGYSEPGTAIARQDWVAEYKTDETSTENNKSSSYGTGYSARVINSATLRLSDKINLLFKYNNAAGATIQVKKNGTVLEEEIDYLVNNGMILIPRLSPVDYSSVYTVTAFDGENIMQTVTYSVYSYCTVKQTADTDDLFRAIFNYGESAKALIQ